MLGAPLTRRDVAMILDQFKLTDKVAIVTGGAGHGFMQRMARHGIRVLATSETDIPNALGRISAGEPLPEAAPHEHCQTSPP